MAQALFKAGNRRVRFSGPEVAEPQRKARRRVFLRVRTGKEQKGLGIKALPQIRDGRRDTVFARFSKGLSVLKLIVDTLLSQSSFTGQASHPDNSFLT
jgi:hypothetical protein